MVWPGPSAASAHETLGSFLLRLLLLCTHSSSGKTFPWDKNNVCSYLQNRMIQRNISKEKPNITCTPDLSASLAQWIGHLPWVV